jgi:hypothetical protein
MHVERVRRIDRRPAMTPRVRLGRMKFIRALLLVLPAVLVLAKPGTAQAGCTDNSFYPLSVGTTRTYQSPTGKQNRMTVVSVAGSTVTTQNTDLSNPSAPIGTAVITCVPGGILFDLAQAVSGPISAKITSASSGITIPYPDQFKVFSAGGSGVGRWTHSFTIQVQNGPVTMSMDTTETHTVVQKDDPVSVPAHLSGWRAFKIEVVATTTLGSITGVPSGVHFPPIPPSTSTIYEWIVEKVGLVQYGPASGPFTKLINCGTTPCPS